MGNESSQLNGLEIEDEATEITDLWAQYQAKIKDSCKYFSLKSDGSVSVFKGKAVSGPIWTVGSPLEKFSNNLLRFRHPNIVRFISVWQQHSVLYMATEFVQPLSQILSQQCPLQLCIGLNNILKALIFLHDQGKVSHCNVSISAIFVTGDCQWKLGSLQYLCPFSDLTVTYLRHARIHRYNKAVDPNEDSMEATETVDQYAFATLVEDLFSSYNEDVVSHLQDFKKYCKENLQHSDPSKRPKLSTVLTHNFFNHEFITIYNFLTLLPLKSDEDKANFFSGLLDNLKYYDEETVAKLLSGLLLSRLALLDPIARSNVIPYLITPKDERVPDNKNDGFFSPATFTEHIKPKLIQLFSVRDSHVRMFLLKHFTKFLDVFSHEELSHQILPELLLGIKDKEDRLVSATLVCLSELVPILGADTVIGGKRAKLFTDGRPNQKINESSKYLYRTSNTTVDSNCVVDVYSNLANVDISMNERPTPVGGEAGEDDEISEGEWNDWGNSNNLVDDSVLTSHLHLNNTIGCDNVSDVSKSNEINMENLNKHNDEYKNKLKEKSKNIKDLSELDIKTQVSSSISTKDEFDFFADMEPVIEKQAIANISSDVGSKLQFIPDLEEGDDEGWNDESWS